MPAVASSAPAVLIAHLAAATTTLRVGSGGVMLPNHAPLVVAEQFGDAGGAAPGADRPRVGPGPRNRPADGAGAQAHARDAGRHLPRRCRRVDQLSACRARARPAVPFRIPVRATSPRSGSSARPSSAPSWRGSWDCRTPSPTTLLPTCSTLPLTTYRSNFRPSILHAEPRSWWPHPCSVHRARRRPTGCRARPRSASCSCGRAAWARCPLPEEAAQYSFTAAERSIVDEAMSTHLIGDPKTVTEGLQQLQARTEADEIMLSTRSHSYETRLRSLSLIAQGWDSPSAPRG